MSGSFANTNALTGTSSNTFRIGNFILKNTASGLQVRNSTDTEDRNLEAYRFTAMNVVSEYLSLNGRIIVLNNDFLEGTPVEEAGFNVVRGDEAPAKLRWMENIDRWGGSSPYINDTATYPFAICIHYSFTSSNLSSGTLNISHGLNIQHVFVAIFNNSNQMVQPMSVTCTNAYNVSINLSNHIVTGTWKALIIG